MVDRLLIIVLKTRKSGKSAWEKILDWNDWILFQMYEMTGYIPVCATQSTAIYLLSDKEKTIGKSGKCKRKEKKN